MEVYVANMISLVTRNLTANSLSMLLFAEDTIVVASME